MTMPSGALSIARWVHDTWEDFYGWLAYGDPHQRIPSLIILLRYTHDFMKEHSLTYWIDFGVLLGAIRHHGQLIPWDYDLDVSMLEEDWQRMEEILKTRLVEEGKGVVTDNPFRVKFECAGCWRFYYHDCWVDILKCKLSRDKKYIVSMLPEDCKMGEVYPDHPTEDVFPLNIVEMYGIHDVPVPNNPHGYLARIFGNYQRCRKIPLFFLWIYHPVMAFQTFIWAPFTAERQKRK